MKQFLLFLFITVFAAGCNVVENKDFLIEKKLVTPSISIISGTNETITNTTVTLKADTSESGVEYTWSIAGIGTLNINSGQQVIFSADTQGGFATISCYTKKNGRSGSDPASIIINVLLNVGQLPTPVISFPGGTNLVETNTTIQLTASGSISGSIYNWSIISGNGSIDPIGDTVTYSASNIIERVTVTCFATKTTYVDSFTATNYIDVVRSILTYTNNLILWLDAEDTNYIIFESTPNISNIFQWKDKSGLSNNTIANSTTTEQPIWRTNIRGGLPAVYFDGATAGRYLKPFLNISNYTTRELTVFCVFAHTNLGLAGGTLWQTRTNVTTSGWAGFTPWTGAAPGIYYLGTNLTTGVISKNPTSFLTNYWYISTVLYGSSSIALYQNGISTNSASVMLPDYYHNYLQIGRRQAGGAGYFYRGFIGEILVYKTALLPADRLSVERYLGKKWGITVP